MCGRLSMTISDPLTAAEMLAQVIPSFEVASLSSWLARAEYHPRYNVGPGQDHWLVRGRSARPILDLARWGFELESDKKLVINARSETVARRPMFRESFARARCLVVADGFFEWDHRGSVRQPWWFRRADRRLMLLGGVSTPPSPRHHARFAVLTAPADAELARIHHRMPVLIEPDEVERWLFSDLRGASELLTHRRPPSLEGTPVSRHVNDVAHDDPDCVAAIDPTASA